ncbi:hypothetical protein C922_04574 [Plasmodium inui San Antonio 1]|uniref:Asparagine-rich protein n=1 Tax=Plasmodium inui San Antonio 1 TaxID=1237626 RepID=W7AIE6_9APIC|nr:hypothetical protein C922_04574 [Plasmodium inui San Antonio 1]EUD65061.1 hypothetical protein C922_04574 [Plasmodium inui San Antonio 1]
MENKNFSQNIFYKGFNERRVNYLNVNANTEFENAHSLNVSSGVTPIKNANEESSMLKMNAQKVSGARQAGNTKVNQTEFVDKIQSHVNLNNIHSNAPYANGGLLYVDNKMSGANVNNHVYSSLGNAPSGLAAADGSAHKNIFTQGIYPDVKSFDRVDSNRLDANRLNMNTFSNSRNVPMKSGEYIFSGAQEHLGYMDAKEGGKGGPPGGGGRVGSNPIARGHAGGTHTGGTHIASGNLFGGHVLGMRGKENQLGAYRMNPVNGGPMPASGKSAAAYEGDHAQASRMDSMMKDGLFGSMYRTIQGGTSASMNVNANANMNPSTNTNVNASTNAQSSLSNFLNGAMIRNKPPPSDTAMNEVPFQTPENLNSTKNPNLKVFNNQRNKLKDVDASNMSTNLSHLSQFSQLRQNIPFSNFSNTVSTHHHRVNNNQSFNHISNLGSAMNKLDSFNLPPTQGSNSMHKGALLNSTLLSGALNSNGMSIPGMNLSNGGNLHSYGKHSITNPLSGNALGMDGGGTHFTAMVHDVGVSHAGNQGNLESHANVGSLESHGNMGSMANTNLAGIPMANASSSGNLMGVGKAPKGIAEGHIKDRGNLINYGYLHSKGKVGDLIGMGVDSTKGGMVNEANSNYIGMSLFGAGIPRASGLHYVSAITGQNVYPGEPLNLKSNSEKAEIQRGEATVLKGGVMDGSSAITRTTNQSSASQSGPNNNVISTDNYANLLKHLCTPIKNRLASNTTDRLNRVNIGEYATQEGKFPGGSAKESNILGVHESAPADMFVGSGPFKGNADEGNAQENVNIGGLSGTVDFSGDGDVVRKEPPDSITSSDNAAANIGGGAPSWGHVYDLKKMNRFAEKKRRDEETIEAGGTNRGDNGPDVEDHTQGHKQDRHHCRDDGKKKPIRTNKTKTKAFFYINPKYIIEPLKRKIYQNMSIYIENLISDVQASENKNRGEILAELHNTPWFCMVFDFDGISKLLNVFNKYLIYSDSLIIPDVLIGKKLEAESTCSVLPAQGKKENQSNTEKQSSGESHPNGESQPNEEEQQNGEGQPNEEKQQNGEGQPNGETQPSGESQPKRDPNYDHTQQGQGQEPFHHYFKKSDNLDFINKKINEYEHSIIESAEKLSYLKELCTSIKGQVDTKKKKLLLLIETAKLKLFAYKSKELQTIIDIEKNSGLVTEEHEQINLTNEYYDMFKKINDGLNFLRKYSNVIISTQTMHDEITNDEENKHMCQSSVSTDDLSCENNLNGVDQEEEEEEGEEDDNDYEEEEDGAHGGAHQHGGEANYQRNDHTDGYAHDHLSNMHMSPGKRKKRRKKRNAHEDLLQRKNPPHDEFDDKADKEVSKKRKTVNEIKNLQWEKEDNEEWVDEFLEDF